MATQTRLWVIEKWFKTSMHVRTEMRSPHELWVLDAGNWTHAYSSAFYQRFPDARLRFTITDASATSMAIVVTLEHSAGPWSQLLAFACIVILTLHVVINARWPIPLGFTVPDVLLQNLRTTVTYDPDLALNWTGFLMSN